MAWDIGILRRLTAWAIILPFLWYCHPTNMLLLLGTPLSVLGLLVRGWAAGSIDKDQELTTSGPYAYLRNPLYLGTFLIGTGVTVAGGASEWILLFLAYFIAVYGTTMSIEHSRLTKLFGQAYREYASSVPSFVPRVLPYRSFGGSGRDGFRFKRYCRNKEWEALLGVLAMFSFLTLKATFGWFGF